MTQYLTIDMRFRLSVHPHYRMDIIRHTLIAIAFLQKNQLFIDFNLYALYSDNSLKSDFLFIAF